MFPDEPIHGTFENRCVKCPGFTLGVAAGYANAQAPGGDKIVNAPPQGQISKHIFKVKWRLLCLLSFKYFVEHMKSASLLYVNHVNICQLASSDFQCSFRDFASVKRIWLGKKYRISVKGKYTFLIFWKTKARYKLQTWLQSNSFLTHLPAYLNRLPLKMNHWLLCFHPHEWWYPPHHNIFEDQKLSLHLPQAAEVAGHVPYPDLFRLITFMLLILVKLILTSKLLSHLHQLILIKLITLSACFVINVTVLGQFHISGADYMN